MPSSLQLQTAVPNPETAQRIAETLVQERLAACVQTVGPIQSTYRWEGKVETATEYLLLVKTTAAHRDAVIERARELHPYEVPEIIATEISGGLPAYLNWIAESV